MNYRRSLLIFLCVNWIGCVIGEEVEGSNNDKMVDMVNNLTTMKTDLLETKNYNITVDMKSEEENSTTERIEEKKNDEITTTESSDVEMKEDVSESGEKIMLVFPKSSFKDKLTPKPKIQETTERLEATSTQQTTPKVDVTTKTPSLVKPLKSFRSQVMRREAHKPQNVTSLEKLVENEIKKSYVQLNEKTRKTRVRVVKRKKLIRKPPSTQHRFGQRIKTEKVTQRRSTDQLQIVGPIPSGFFGNKTQETTFDGINFAELEPPRPPSEQEASEILYGSGMVSPEFLNFVRQKYQEALESYKKALITYQVYIELYRKANQMGTV